MMLSLETCGVARTRLGWPTSITVIVSPMERREKPLSQLGVAIETGVGVDFGWLLHETTSATKIQIDHESENLFFMMHFFLLKWSSAFFQSYFINYTPAYAPIILQADSQDESDKFQRFFQFVEHHARPPGCSRRN